MNSGSFYFLGIQILGAICLSLWAYITSYIFFRTVKSIDKLRLCKLYEVAGIDILMYTIADVLGKKDSFD
jgi:ammonia channel protein AmtB